MPSRSHPNRKGPPRGGGAADPPSHSVVPFTNRTALPISSAAAESATDSISVAEEGTQLL